MLEEKRVKLRQQLFKMASFCVPILLAMFVMFCLGPMNVQTMSTRTEICGDKICHAGKGQGKDGCYCCFDCTLNNREVGLQTCPKAVEFCSGCKPGFEQIPNMKDRCREVKDFKDTSKNDTPQDTSVVGKDVVGKSPSSLPASVVADRPGDWVAVTNFAIVTVAIAAVGGVMFAAVRYKTGPLVRAAEQVKSRSRSSSGNGGNNGSSTELELLPLNGHGSQHEENEHLSSVGGSEGTQLLSIDRSPVEDLESQYSPTSYTVEGPRKFVIQEAEGLQKAVPINAREAMNNSAQSFASHQEPVENDESLSHAPSAPPEYPDSTTTCIEMQPDSGFQAGFDDAQSEASTYSNATTAVVGAMSPQGSPISANQSDDGINFDESSSYHSFPTGAQNTPLPEGVQVNLELRASVSVNYP